MNYFLAKTEPGTYSIDDLEREHKTLWDGVTNPQAVRAIREMRPGDRIFIYHSGGVSAVVEIEFAGRLDPPITLAEIKQSKQFDDWALVRQGRLSTMSVPEKFVAWIRKSHPRGRV
jgi:predicted RNA-binding protein with PUA-like domain